MYFQINLEFPCIPGQKTPHWQDLVRSWYESSYSTMHARCLLLINSHSIGHVVDKIAGNCTGVYSTFDCSQSFHQIKYSKNSRHITAFTTSDGKRMWFKKLIMGHKTSGAQFSRCMAKILSSSPFEQLVYFLDDLLLSSDTVAEHLKRLRLVFLKALSS